MYSEWGDDRRSGEERKGKERKEIKTYKVELIRYDFQYREKR